jgi:ubiquinone/menaquinone biosynthesis C-methylase UbiE
MRSRIKKSETLLDADCGMGQWVLLCNKNEIMASGLDYSVDMISLLKDIFPSKKGFTDQCRRRR